MDRTVVVITSEAEWTRYPSELADFLSLQSVIIC